MRYHANENISCVLCSFWSVLLGLNRLFPAWQTWLLVRFFPFTMSLWFVIGHLHFYHFLRLQWSMASSLQAKKNQWKFRNRFDEDNDFVLVCKSKIRDAGSFVQFLCWERQRVHRNFWEVCEISRCQYRWQLCRVWRFATRHIVLRMSSPHNSNVSRKDTSWLMEI